MEVWGLSYEGFGLRPGILRFWLELRVIFMAGVVGR